MGKKFYRLVDDPTIEDRWHLRAPVDSSGREIDPRLFTQCTSYNGLAQRLTLPLRRSGRPLSFTFGDFDMPVVNRAVKEVIAPIVEDQVQWLDVDIASSDNRFAILNATSCVSCIDDHRSKFTRWQEADERPDKIGQYRMFGRLIVDPDRCGNRDMFRIAEWKIALIVSERLKSALESVERLGVRFEPVS
jgi:hypothetical protein